MGWVTDAVAVIAQDMGASKNSKAPFPSETHMDIGSRDAGAIEQVLRAPLPH
jgi:hypothetical protein